MIFSRLENVELEKRTNLSVGSSDFVSLNRLKTFLSSSSVSDVLTYEEKILSIDHWLYFWDESNRLRSAVKNEAKMTHFIYDASGERVLKALSRYQKIYDNGTPGDGGATLEAYTLTQVHISR